MDRVSNKFLKSVLEKQPEEAQVFEKGLKIQLFIIDNSNSCRSQFSWQTLEDIQRFCDKYFVKEVKFIEKAPKTTYAVVVYKE